MFVVGDLSPLFQVPTFYVNAINIRHYLSQHQTLFESVCSRRFIASFSGSYVLRQCHQHQTLFECKSDYYKPTTTNRLLQTDYYKRYKV